MAELIFDLYQGETEYSDGAEIEKRMLERAKNNEDSLPYDNWPEYYHFSPLRENILNWYPFSEGCSILEIGSGCGAITGLLCRKAKEVVSLELTPARASINYERHKDCDNLKIFVGNIENFQYDCKFDYAVINGVLEYAGAFITGSHPHAKFLDMVSKHVKDEGVLLLAIENRLGLKYFSGAREDHFGSFFTGINGYVGEKIRTFSKEELNEQISLAGLIPVKYYYPYPDYKFPFEIFSDDTVNTIKPTSSDIPMDASRAVLYNSRSVYRSLMREGIMDRFSNSFLVEIAKITSVKPTPIAFAKVSSNRRKNFCIATFFESSRKEVYKKALYTEGLSHINRIRHFKDFKRNSFTNVSCSGSDNYAVFPYIKKISLDEILYHTYLDDWNSFIEKIKAFRDQLYLGIEPAEGVFDSEFTECFGETRCSSKLRWMTDINVDLIADNIFVNNEGYEIIDYEWHLPCPVPLEYVFWRMLTQFIDNHTLCDKIPPVTYMEIIGADQEVEKCFIEWEKYFAHEYVGIADLTAYSQGSYPIDLDKQVSRSISEHTVKSTLFFDAGQGFNDADIATRNAAYASEQWSAAFIDERLHSRKGFRWDPIEGYPCEITINGIDTDARDVELAPINAEPEKKGEAYTFYTFDPQFRVKGDFADATYLKIYYSIKILDWKEGYQQREIELAECRGKIRDIKAAIQTNNPKSLAAVLENLKNKR